MAFKVEAKVIEKSIYSGHVLTTMQVRYPRFIHSELMTHRVLSRNASSSRAIPVKKMLAQVWNDPAEPVHWGLNRPGMQAKEELTGWRLGLAKGLWRAAGRAACAFVWAIDKLGGHKQWANRLLEPWQFISVIITATEWENFYALRRHEDAQPEFRVLAEAMWEADRAAVPVVRGRTDLSDPFNWHLPYISDEERRKYPLDTLLKCSVARCARVSYLTHDGEFPSVEQDVKLFDRLIGAVPMHASPIEHQAVIATDFDELMPSNLRGWSQLRKMVEAHPDFFDLIKPGA